MNKQDVKVALSSMGDSLFICLKRVAQFAAFFAVASLLFVGIVWLIKNYAIALFVAFILAVLGVWFSIEVNMARSIREYDEMMGTKNE
jgi:Flp pilus assembly protein TadB